MTTADLMKVALDAAKNAYAPYSKFRVGAAMLTASGKVYTGCNVENASYPVGICAERTALAKAVSEGEREFVKLAVTASPCGMCRQTLAEFGDMSVAFMSDGEIVETTLYKLLPYNFNIT